MRLLVIDSNIALGWRLQNLLNKQFEVHLVRSGTEGQKRAEGLQFDAIILDLALPDVDGEDVCSALRQKGVMTPILILTAKAALASKVRLLEVGADDYLTKPFDMAELHARIRALVRRRQTEPIKLLTVGDLAIDSSRRLVKREGRRINLRRKEFELLEYLVRNRGKVATQAMIRDYVWHEPGAVAENNTVRVHIKNLRDKVDRPFKTSLIKTVRGVGYVLDA